MTKRRVVVTGLGMLSPLGLNSEDTLRKLLARESGIGEITHFDCSNYSTRFAGQINDFDTQEYIEKKETKKIRNYMDLCDRLASTLDSEMGELMPSSM